MTSAPFLAAVVVTYRRDPELRRLLDSLAVSRRRPDLLVVVDNGAQDATRGIVEKTDFPSLYVAAPENAGPGAGWKKGMEAALVRESGVTHFLVLDDDVVLPPEAASRLLAASEDAAIVCPLLLDENDHVWAFPEPLAKPLRATIRAVQTLAQATALLGTTSLPFVWCTGACILVRRDAVDVVGFHRADFWMLGEDLEYSMRVVAHGGGVFLPDLFVPHLPPAPVSAEAAEASNRRKFQSLLQNLSYLALYHPASGHLWSYLPGNVRRYFRTFGWNPVSAFEAARCLWRGIFLGKPAGRE